MPVWTVTGTKYEGVFVVIDDNDNVVLLKRKFNNETDKNEDVTIYEIDEDDEVGLEKILDTVKEIKGNPINE